MKKTVLIIICLGVLILFGVANATLYDRGGGLIYCDVLDITLLADANYAGMLLTWDEAMTWANDLVYQDYKDWRLPTALNQDGTGPDQGDNVTTSEMGHMFYNELGGTAGQSIYDSLDPDLAFFTNLHPSQSPYSHWSSTIYLDPGSKAAWTFSFRYGSQQYGGPTYSYRLSAWAVRDGDSTPIPEPSTVLIDIMPRTCPNPCPLKGGGAFTVAILGTVGLDVNDIDPASVRLEGVAAKRSKIQDKAAPIIDPVECECTTEGGDEFDDLCLSFDKKAILAALGTVSVGDAIPLTLTGELYDSTPIQGQDCILIVEKKGKKH